MSTVVRNTIIIMALLAFAGVNAILGLIFLIIGIYATLGATGIYVLIALIVFWIVVWALVTGRISFH